MLASTTGVQTVREGIRRDSKKLRAAVKGEALQVLELARTQSGTTRARTQRGWVTAETKAGVPLLACSPMLQARDWEQESGEKKGSAAAKSDKRARKAKAAGKSKAKAKGTKGSKAGSKGS